MPSKDIIKKVKRPPTEWERIFANYIVDTGLVSRIYEELLQCNNEKINNLVKTGQSTRIDIFQRR